MRQPLQLQILEPCHEKWHEMTPQQQGRFCGSCQKTVVDFTSMTDSALLDYFKNFKGDTCGRFELSQLQRPLIPPPPQQPAWYKWAFTSLFSFLLFSKAKSQGDVSIKGKVAVTCSNEQVPPEKEPKVAKATQSKPLRIEIKGRVVNENGAGIPYASVQVKGEKWGVSADSSGDYTLHTIIQVDSIDLIYSAMGFEIVEKKLTIAEAGQAHDVCLTLKPYTGEVVITGYESVMGRTVAGAVSVVKRSIWRERKKPSVDTLQITNNVYPNPAKVGSNVHLAFKSAGHFGWRLLDLNGNTLLTQQPVPTYKGQVLDFALPGTIAAGQYFVQIFDADGKTSTTAKLVVIR